MVLMKRKENWPTFGDVFSDFYTPNSPGGLNSQIPSTNVKEKDDEFVVEVAAPGLEKDDFQIDVDDDTLSVRAEKKEEKKDEEKDYTRVEYNYSNFERTFNLPSTVKGEDISANYKNGILNLHLPKNEEAKKKGKRQISIT